MAYGDYDGPNKVNKANKGVEGGACNRTRCQAEPALWYNHGSLSWYCEDCAAQIAFDPFNMQDWAKNFFPKYGHTMFETRAMISERLKHPKVIH